MWVEEVSGAAEKGGGTRVAVGLAVVDWVVAAWGVGARGVVVMEEVETEGVASTVAGPRVAEVTGVAQRGVGVTLGTAWAAGGRGGGSNWRSLP